MDLELTGKRVLVTGSSSGLGADMAILLAQEGAVVVVHGRDETRSRQVADRIVAAGGKAKAVCADLGTEAEVRALAAAADAAFGGIDILVNNAGSRTEGTTGFDIAPSDWLDTFQRNVVAGATLAAYFVPQMKARGWGRIIQISSGLGSTPIGMVPDYSASKAAMNNYTVNLSKALSKTGITVNTVSPGLIWTPANEAFFADLAEAQGRPGEIDVTLADFIAAAPQTVGRVGQPRDIAAGVAYLASPLADYVNGTNLRIDGGHSPSVT
jgi:NAD(P)-dependent dehydrogenase (short-subunit alcohol dehydrogenase family)